MNDDFLENKSLIVPVRYPDDCILLRKKIKQLGYDVSLHQVQEFWSRRSEDYSAGWLNVHDEDLKAEIEEYIHHLHDVLEGKPYES